MLKNEKVLEDVWENCVEDLSLWFDTDIIYSFTVVTAICASERSPAGMIDSYPCTVIVS